MLIPEAVVLRGTTRSFSPAVRDQPEAAIRRVAEGACRACGAEMELRYERRYPPTINAAREAEIAATAAASLVGESNVRRDLLPSMGAEDFACFLEDKPGAYIWIGNGSAETRGMLHSLHYDFNDAIFPLGASYWVRLAESVLAKEQVAAGEA
jgi:metal-dependent amidase/aminoacylase/carboxypeptidase family protein